MTKRIGACAVFLGLLALLLLGAGWVLCPRSNEELRFPTASAFVAEPENSFDYVILGDSLTLFGLAPKVILEEQGIPGYNCSVPLQTLAQSRSYLERFLSCQSPRLVLLEANVLYREVSPEEPALERVQSRLTVFRDHNNWKTLNLKTLTQCPRWTWRHDGWGHFSSQEVGPAATEQYMVDPQVPAPIPESSQRMLESLRSLCQKHEAQLLLISVPNAAVWDLERHRQVAALAEELGLHYLDMNLEQVGLDWQTDCLDGGDHLNEWGAKKVSRYLATYLADTGLFPDRRQAPDYAGWNGDLETFHNWVETTVNPLAEEFTP